VLRGSSAGTSRLFSMRVPVCLAGVVCLAAGQGQGKAVVRGEACALAGCWCLTLCPRPAPAGAGSDSRPERIKRGGHVSDRHDALPPGKRWHLDDLDHPSVRLAGAPRAEHSFLLPSLPQRSLGGIDRPSPQRGEKPS
jgi:hypothetical protein